MISPKPKSPHPLRITLRVLAAKLERDLLGADERRGLAALLRGLADDQTADELLGVERAANRPVGTNIEQRVTTVETLRLPPEHGGEGITAAKAIEEAAKIHNRASSSVKAEYYSDRGKEIRKKLDYPEGMDRPLTWSPVK